MARLGCPMQLTARYKCHYLQQRPDVSIIPLVLDRSPHKLARKQE
jgi:hypothetical protein